MDKDPRQSSLCLMWKNLIKFRCFPLWRRVDSQFLRAGMGGQALQAKGVSTATHRYFPATLKSSLGLRCFQVSFWSLTSNDHSTTDAKVTQEGGMKMRKQVIWTHGGDSFKSWTKYVSWACKKVIQEGHQVIRCSRAWKRLQKKCESMKVFHQNTYEWGQRENYLLGRREWRERGGYRQIRLTLKLNVDYLKHEHWIKGPWFFPEARTLVPYS